MQYISTRGTVPKIGFADVLMTGLAEDGGLYLPEKFPKLSDDLIQKMASMSYQDIAFEVMFPYVEGDINAGDFKQMIDQTYGIFSNKEVTPITQLNDQEYLLDLFHGPTLAFKDVALQLLGNLFDYVLKRQNKQVCILGATSGDTGSAAIAGCRGRDNVQIVILHPYQKVSDVQRRQMTTVLDDNVMNIAVEGSFDDCQNIVKTLFSDLSFKKEKNLTAVNSINWARIMAQIVYYFYACSRIVKGDDKINVCVPTGNFGNVFAGYVAKQMGAPINQLIVATNSNDILYRFFKTGKMTMEGVTPTVSPSMDIQISSNFERLLYLASGGDHDLVINAMNDLKLKGTFSFEHKKMVDFVSFKTDEEQTQKTIQKIYKENKVLIDPHTAVGVYAMHQYHANGKTITLSTAHPAKFPEVVEQATGEHPPLPDHMKDLFKKEERFTVCINDANAIKDLI